MSYFIESSVAKIASDLSEADISSLKEKAEKNKLLVQ